jgi:uncharacterized protein (TIGR02611 family)
METDRDHPAANAVEAARPQRFRWFHDMRAWIHARPHVHLCWKVLSGIVGGLVVIIGLILVPLPGPGWLVVFIGLTILASEFHFFHRIITWLRAQLHRFWDWAKARGPRWLRRMADRNKADVDAAHEDAHRTMGRQARPGH